MASKATRKAKHSRRQTLARRRQADQQKKRRKRFERRRLMIKEVKRRRRIVRVYQQQRQVGVREADAARRRPPGLAAGWPVCGAMPRPLPREGRRG